MLAEEVLPMSSSVSLEPHAEEKGLGDLASAAPGGDVCPLSAVKSNAVRSLCCLATWRLKLSPLQAAL